MFATKSNKVQFTVTDLFQLLSSRRLKFLGMFPPAHLSVFKKKKKICTPVGVFPFQPWMHVGFFPFKSLALENECCREMRARTGSRSGLLKNMWKPLVCLLKFRSCLFCTCSENVFPNTVFYTGCSPLLMITTRPNACSSFTICIKWNFDRKSL